LSNIAIFTAMVQIADVSDYEAEPESLQSVAGGGITSCHRDGREGAGCPAVANLKTPADSKKRIVAPKGGNGSDSPAGI
jgi:hypothetical protein